MTITLSVKILGATIFGGNIFGGIIPNFGVNFVGNGQNFGGITLFRWNNSKVKKLRLAAKESSHRPPCVRIGYPTRFCSPPKL